MAPTGANRRVMLMSMVLLGGILLVGAGLLGDVRVRYLARLALIAGVWLVCDAFMTDYTFWEAPRGWPALLTGLVIGGGLAVAHDRRADRRAGPRPSVADR